MTLRRRTYLTEAKGFKKGEFEWTYNLGPGKGTEQRKVSGYVMGHIGIDKRGQFWFITHIPSGYGLGNYKTLKRAKLFGQAAHKLISNSKDASIENSFRRDYKGYEAYLWNNGDMAFDAWIAAGRPRR